MIDLRHAAPYTAVSVPGSANRRSMLNAILSSHLRVPQRKIDKPIVLYGAGKLGRMAKEFFDTVGVPVEAVVDIHAAQHAADPFWKGIRTLAPGDVTDADRDGRLLIICIVTVPLVELRDRIIKEGWSDTAFFYDIAQNYAGRHPLNNGWFIDSFDATDRKNIREIYTRLDATSRDHYLQFLAWRRLRIELRIPKIVIRDDNRFFIPEIAEHLCDDEVFVDCGAHKGYVIQRFLEQTKGIYQHIYAIEPDRTHLSDLRAATRGLHDVTILSTALGARRGERKFLGGFGFASRLSPKGIGTVEVTPLDQLHIHATFIKMHLEGGELDALKGALKTLQTNRPLLAVTVYHNADGVWRTPLFLVQHLTDYTFHLRLHGWGGTGMVLYAIPREQTDKYR